MHRLLPLCLLALFCACETDSAPGAAGHDDLEGRTTFVTRLGIDTIAVEQFTHTAAGVDARVVLRSPDLRVYEYDLDLDGETLRRYEARTFLPGASVDAGPIRHEIVTPDGDSLRVSVTSDDETWTSAMAGGPDALPFIDMVHWPYEVAMTRSAAAGRDSLVQPLFSSRRTMPFVMRRTGPEAMAITHPSRGTMDVEVDATGRLVRLDAGATTRKLIVERVADVDLDAFVRRSLAQAEGGVGPLSGRGEASIDIGAATLSVDYGQPLKRGREVWGALVPWGERWRTGANLATHFETTAALNLGGLMVPAGRYTLYTIPAPDGGMLIVNKETGQTGTRYDESQDLGRVALTRFDLDETVEAFTIAFDRAPGVGGVLKLMWDQSVFSVPFSVVE